MELNLSYEGCTLGVSAVHDRGGRVLVELIVEGDVMGSLELLPDEAETVRLSLGDVLASVRAEKASREFARLQGVLL